MPGKPGCNSSRLDRAYLSLDEAGLDGKYRSYEKALAAFDDALAAGADADEVERGKIRTRVAYAREALLNRDFELAISLLEPVTDKSLEAHKLMNRVVDKETAYRLSHRNFRLLFPVLIALAIVMVVVAANIWQYVKDSGAYKNPLLVLADSLNRSRTLQASFDLQADLVTVHSEVLVRRRSLVVYDSFPAAFALLQSGYDRMLLAHGGSDGEKAAVYRYLSEGLPALRAFREDLLEEGDEGWRERNRPLRQRLEKMIDLLEERHRAGGTGMPPAKD